MHTYLQSPDGGHISLLVRYVRKRMTSAIVRRVITLRTTARVITKKSRRTCNKKAWNLTIFPGTLCMMKFNRLTQW